MKAKCNKCSYFGEMYEHIQITKDGVPQVRGMCGKCTEWVMWVPYKDSPLVKKILLTEGRKEKESEKVSI